MPLNTEITRDGQALSVRWGGFHVAAMVLATAAEEEDSPILTPPIREELERADHFLVTRADVVALMGYHVIAATALNAAPYTLKERHAFLDSSDGEFFELLPGDVLNAWRSS